MFTLWSVKLSSCGPKWESRCPKLQLISSSFSLSADGNWVPILGSHSEFEKKKRTSPIKPLKPSISFNFLSILEHKQGLDIGTKWEDMLL